MKQFLKVDEVAEKLTVSPATLHRWTKEGVIPFVRVNRRIFFDPDKIVEFVEEHS